MTEASVLAWADAHHRRTGSWPSKDSGLIPGGGGVTWTAVNLAFRRGSRGLTGPTTLARFLSEHRGVPHPDDLPRLTIAQILRWARTHYQETGNWPRRTSGPIAGADGETWSAVHSALRNGRRGLPGGSSLPRLLAESHRCRSTPL